MYANLKSLQERQGKPSNDNELMRGARGNECKKYSLFYKAKERTGCLFCSLLHLATL